MLRELYHNIIDYKGEEIFSVLLQPWARKNDYANFFEKIKDKLTPEKKPGDEIYELYALSRILDVLTLRFQPVTGLDESRWRGHELRVEEYAEFAQLLGLEVGYPKYYDNFYCEILRAQKGKESFKIDEVVYPALSFSGLLINKAGVEITLAPENYDIRLINNAKLYWAYWRKNRETNDMSAGWGSNSQWRTEFRIDIETKDRYYYNCEGKYDLSIITPFIEKELKAFGFETEEAIEMVKFRHFVKSKKDDRDVFPYDFRYNESKEEARRF